MRIAYITAMFLLLTACTERSAQEFVFRQTLEHKLIKLCGEDKECVQAVEAQTEPCMEKGDWFKFIGKQDDPVELKRFTETFYACVVDADGKPYFHSNL